MADWDGDANSQTFRIFDGDFNLLFELASFDVTDVTYDAITPSISANTLILQWDYPYAVAMDNIAITAVPEPSSLAFLAVFFGCYRYRRFRSRGWEEING